MNAVDFAPAPGGGYRVTGRLGFDTVHAIWRSSREALAGGGDQRVDLGGVTYVDSAGLALVLEWVGQARAAGGRLELLHAPPKLLDLARISEVEALLGAAQDPGSSSSKSSSG